MMSDAQIRDQIERADRFRDELRDAIAATISDPESLCADAQRRTLGRIAETLDQVPITTFANLANLNAAMRGALMGVIEIKLQAARGGPSLDYADAAAFLAEFNPMIDVVLKRKIN